MVQQQLRQTTEGKRAIMRRFFSVAVSGFDDENTDAMAQNEPELFSQVSNKHL
jgi:hypothetical protein